MAIARGAGTEIIRSAYFEDVDAVQALIVGEQHHIYTVLSIIVYCAAVDAVTDTAQCYLTGYDSHGGDTGQNMWLFTQNIEVDKTFVWNDKFSFNGFEPTNFTGPMDDATKQNAIADQGQATAQKLMFTMTSADGGGQNYMVGISYIDQNNS